MGGDIEIAIGTGGEEPVSGKISVGYSGSYDGIVVNAQVLGSNSLVVYSSCNGRDAGGAVSRLFVPRADVDGGHVSFAARIEPVPAARCELKFRASIIEQHKEIDSDVAFAEAGA